MPLKTYWVFIFTYIFMFYCDRVEKEQLKIIIPTPAHHVSIPTCFLSLLATLDF